MTTADELLADSTSYLSTLPFEQFRYSNFAAGLIGSLLETRFLLSFEALIQRELFQPLGIHASFDIRMADTPRIADSYRVLPAKRRASFDAVERMQSAQPIDTPDPQRHFLLASGNLFITAEDMAKLCLLVIRGGMHGREKFISDTALTNLLVPHNEGNSRWPGMRHAMGLFTLDDKTVSPKLLHGHQGFAYGAVNGCFFDDMGKGFVSFNSGASEKRIGRLSCLNRDLIRELLS
jgi:CubicO group peptidase (beta-lactamase class C family)